MNESEKIELANDEETARRVEEWMKAQKLQTAQAKVEKKKVTLPEDPVVSENHQAKMIDEVIPKTAEVEVTEDEQTRYMKAMLNDEPVKLDIMLFGDKMKLTYRARSMHEQERVLAVVRQDIKDGLIASDDAALAYTRVQQYCMCVQLQSINDEAFAGIELKAGSTVAHDVKALRAAYLNHIPKMSHPKWVAVMEGLVMFESKCKKISEECLNKDFLKPRR